MTKTDLQVNFRMPADLKAKLEGAAKENHRSLTAEVVARLESTFSPPIPRSSEQDGELFHEGIGPTVSYEPPAARRVIKRNGQVFEYSDDQITRAIMRAFEAMDINPAARGGAGPKPRKKYPRE